MVLRPHSASERSRTLKSPFAPLPVGFVSFARAGGSLTVAITVECCCILNTTDQVDLRIARLVPAAFVKRVRIRANRPKINESPVSSPTLSVRQNSPPTLGSGFHQSTGTLASQSGTNPPLARPNRAGRRRLAGDPQPCSVPRVA